MRSLSLITKRLLATIIFAIVLFSNVGYSTAYNPDAAVSYAYAHWNSYNSGYAHYSSDCANFVSQCLHEGGIAMRESGNDQWFMKRVLLVFWSHSNSWTVAYDLGEYIKDNSWCDMVRYYASISTLGTYENFTEKGDVVRYYFGYKNNPNYHTALVTQDTWLNGTRITQHSTDRLDVFINYTSNESGTNTPILDYSQRAATSCEIYCMDSAIS